MNGLCLLGSHIAFEIDSTARAFLKDNFENIDLRGSVRDRGDIPAHDNELIVAGFPCQPFSLLGKQEGWSDSRGRGNLLQCTVDMVMSRLPSLVLLENVAAFAKSDDGRILKWLINTLEAKYVVYHTILCSSDFGLPQSRRRWFLVAVRRDRQVAPFAWPQPLPALPLVALLGPPASSTSPANRPGRPGSLAAKNVERAIRGLEANNVSVANCNLVIDCDASAGWCGKPRNIAPCLTKSRRAGFWHLGRGERLSATTSLRLQGVCGSSAVWPQADGDIRALAGNSMSLPIVELIVRNAFISIGYDHSRLPDRWTTGSAFADLVHDAWGASVPSSVIGQLPAHVAALCNQKPREDSRIAIRRAPAEARDLTSRMRYDCIHIDDNFNICKAAARRSRRSMASIRLPGEGDDYDELSSGSDIVSAGGDAWSGLEARLKLDHGDIDDNYKAWIAALRQHEHVLSRAQFSQEGDGHERLQDDTEAASDGDPPLIGTDLAPASDHCYPLPNVDLIRSPSPINTTLNPPRPEAMEHSDPEDTSDISGERRALGTRLRADPFGDLFLRSEPHAANATPADLVASNLSSLLTGDSTFATFARRWAHGPPAAAGRQRDLFPLPPRGTSSDPVSFSVCTNAALCALDFLNNGMRIKGHQSIPASTQSRPTRAQRTVHEFVHTRCGDQLERLTALPHDFFRHVDGSFQRYEPLQADPGPELAADKVDLPTNASTCIASNFVTPELGSAIDAAEGVMPSCSPDSKWPTVASRDRREYLKLIVREFRVGKVRFMLRPKHVAGRFVVGKRDTERQRPVWNGSSLSEAAHAPPMPRRLANPACLPHIRVRPGDRLFFSKRDAASFFDALQAPIALRAWFGCPGVKVSDLAAALGITLADVRYLCDDLDNGPLTPKCIVYPCITSWPMGFSWSSAVAQDVSVSALIGTGLPEEHILSDLHPFPECHDELALIATDDTILIHTDREQGLRRVKELEAIFKTYGIPQRVDKDETVEDHVTAIGCHLANDPARIEPALEKLGNVLRAIFDLNRTRRASPLGIAALLGVMQWLALMARAFLSIFDRVYVFARRPEEKLPIDVPIDVMDELIIFVMLSPLLVADLTREFHPLLAATDASPSYGFGASVCPITSHEAVQLGTYSDKRGDFIRLRRDGGEDDEGEKPRIGVPRELRIHKRHFVDIFSIRAKLVEHAGVLEARGLLLLLRWWLRSVQRHGCRMLTLIDAKAILAATAKGRSGAPGFKQILRSIGAHLLAGNVLIYPLYIPSEDNPSDAPSRGKRFRRGVARDGVISLKTKRVRPCPTCGVAPHRHPLHLSKKLRGRGLFCRGDNTGCVTDNFASRGHAFRGGRWLSYIDHMEERVLDAAMPATK